MTLLALGSGVFVAIGLWIIEREPVIALGCIIFFGLYAGVGLVGLLPNSSYLTLTEQGFLFSSLFRKHFVTWSDVQSFVPVKIQFNRLVGWNYSSEYLKSRRLRSVNSAIAGVEATLPDTYGLPAEELAELMNQLRKKHAKTALE
jgi:hypothetical protein